MTEEEELLHSIKLLMDQCERLRGEYQRGLDDAIKAIRAGRDDWSSGEDIGKTINWILGVAEGRIADLSRTTSTLTRQSSMMSSQAQITRDDVARAIYETEPFYEGGEYVDGFHVSPGGNLSWEQACARDAEFAQDNIMLPITKFAYDAADAVMALKSTPE